MPYIKFLVILYSAQLFSQNLVLNPSFEKATRCAELIGDFNDNVTNWSTPSIGTTDFFNSCSRGVVGIPNNFNGKQHSEFGKNYAGFYLYSDDNYREYVQGQISQTLEKGVRYKISFYINLAEKSDFAIKSIEFILSENKLNTLIDKELSNKRLKHAYSKEYTIYTIESNIFYDNSDDWVMISKEIIAKGNENYITIGNLDKNSKTDKLLVSNKNRFNMSYYYIDQVSIERTDYTDPIPKVFEKPIPQPKKIELNKDYVFKNVIFDFNSTELSAIAKQEIRSVYLFLKQQVGTKIIISGHTDAIGNFDFNQKLSEHRAQAVATFFEKLELSKNRIVTIGYGNSKPISTNKTEEGRETNRRVEFRIIQK